MVYAPRWKGSDDYDRSAPFPVVRHPGTLMFPEPGVDRRMQTLIREHDIETVWFGAAAPLALLGRARPRCRRPPDRRLHPRAMRWVGRCCQGRSALRRIGNDSDVITYVSRYTRGRFAAAFGPRPGWSTCRPASTPTGSSRTRCRRAELRARYELGKRPVVVCISRLVPAKGQDMLIKGLAGDPPPGRRAALVIVGGGPYADSCTGSPRVRCGA